MNDADLLQSIIESAIDGIVIFGEDGVIELVNPSLCRMFGYDALALKGKSIKLLLFYEPGSGVENGHANAGMQEIIGFKRDGSIFDVRFAVSEVESDGKRVFAGIVHDLTEDRRAESFIKSHNADLEMIVNERTRELQLLIAQLEQAQNDVRASLEREKEINKLKSSFISMASHELRSPLSSIQLSASLIERYYSRMDHQKKMLHLRNIKTAVNDLTAVLDDFLSEEKLQNGNFCLSFQEFDIVTLAKEVVDEMRLMANDGRSIDYQHTGTETRLLLDQTFLKHCMVNLISNAIKYTDEGGHIEFETEIRKRICLVRVKDNGIGIPKESQARIFEPFYRAENTGDAQGTGLGLSIVDHYVRLMGGNISFKSSLKLGTVFTLSFPVKRVQQVSSFIPAEVHQLVEKE